MTYPDKVSLGRLAYVIYEHPELDQFLKFASDFGFELAGRSNDGEIFLRGYGPDPYAYIARQSPADKGKSFCGSGFTALTEMDFKRACGLDGAQVRDISQWPGGGRMVSVVDVNGYEMQIVYGQEKREVPQIGVSNVHHGQPNVNGAVNKARKGKPLLNTRI